VFAGAVLAQNSNTSKKPPKPKPVVDCSTVNDATITTNVKEKLGKAPSLKDLMIDVATSAGVVTLTGTVKKPTQKGTASRVAKSVACVKKVDNQITVEAPPAPTMMPNKNAAPKKPKNSNSHM
jgi:osmotically-inducible protein OsmY